MIYSKLIYKTYKKGFIEVTSFVLLTSLILVLSLTTYLFVSDVLENKIISLERDNMESNLKKLNIELLNIQNFQGSSMSFPINLKKGTIIFSSEKITYYSLLEFDSSNSTCFDELCYSSQGGFETLTLDLKIPYTYTDNFSITPENYQLIFKNIGGNKIEVKFK